MSTNILKKLPEGASQHITAGPYSPVLEIECKKLVVISGQAALDISGKVIGSTIEEQTEVTLENCKKQLATVGCDFNDVFKVNVYMKDLDLWERFNKVYESMIPLPRPARTAVGTSLLSSFLVEVEMWAVKN